ncbi:MAG: hypothetical protein CVU51_03180 [Deltaproteobacteria bacterium HGW-Deltaproteobacteria-1]|jgi:hypothetical protein|nr:MAG: hypothetical protein CVU51_03180 [Deltaproteobacteria bacterium HGW-Deltaproteobacteria-1]
MKAKIMFSVFLLMFSIFGPGEIAAGTEGTNNNFFGTGAGASITSGTNESFFGGNAGNATSSGSHNTFMGYNTGTLNTIGYSNTFLGMNAGYSNTEGYENTFVGRAAGFNNIGSFNSFLGYKAGYSNTTGQFNNFIGQEAGLNNTTGNINNFFGSWSGRSNTTGIGNTFIGDYAGFSNVAEDDNTIVGARADIDGTNDNVTNATAIGYRAYVSQANSLVLGSIKNVNGMAVSVNVGIGTSAPVRQLHVVGDQAVFRMDRPYDTAAFMLVRTDAGGTPLKTFVVGANASGSNSGSFVINDLGTAVSGAGTRRMTIDNNGIATFTNSVYALSFVPTSSLVYKTNIKTYENALETVKKLRGVSFNWKDSGKASVGLIAEEVDKVIPEVVAHNEKDATGVNYDSLVGVLVEAVKEQQTELDILREQKRINEEQQKIIAAHSEEIAELKRLLILSRSVSKAD